MNQWLLGRYMLYNSFRICSVNLLASFHVMINSCVDSERTTLWGTQLKKSNNKSQDLMNDFRAMKMAFISDHTHVYLLSIYGAESYNWSCIVLLHTLQFSPSICFSLCCMYVIKTINSPTWCSVQFLLPFCSVQCSSDQFLYSV